MSKPLLTTITIAILALTPAALASTERVIYSFTGGSDGGSPQAPLLADAAGNLYGTASTGGANNSNCGAFQGCGVVFMLTPPKTRTGSWTETILYQFQGGTDLSTPWAGLIFDKAGNLYGSTFYGGYDQFCCGGVFELSPPNTPGSAWTETVLYDFYELDDDGNYPVGRLVFDNSGNLYGTCNEGGPGVGTVFQLVPPGQPGTQWAENLLHDFEGFSDGAFPQGTLLVDSHGNLYGTTAQGENGDSAVFFELSPPKSGNRWTFTSNLIFDANTEGYDQADLTLLAGRLYGTAGAGGANNAGTIFSLKPPAPGGQWTETTLYTFAGGADGNAPTRSIVADKSGNLYGATTKGGTNDNGTVFKLSPQGGTWIKTTLHKFSGGSDGSQPTSGLIFGKFGALYGVTAAGGSSGNGTVYAVLP